MYEDLKKYGNILDMTLEVELANSDSFYDIKEAIKQIDRHVDGVKGIYIKCAWYKCPTCDQQYEEMKEAIECEKVCRIKAEATK